MLFNPGLMPYI